VIERLPPRARAMPAAAPASPAAAPPAAEAPPAAAPDGAELDARRREIVELSERLGTRSHYEILEVARTATDAEIKEAYFRRARRFHPDVHHHTGLADLAPRLEAVFIRLGDAYEALRYKHSRASYDRSLGMVTPSPQAAPSAPAAEPAAPAPPSAAPADPAFERRRAAEQVRIGERHLQESRYWDAIQCFEGALDYVDGALKQRALLGLARGLMRNPNWVKRAEETLQELLRLSPRHVDGLLELGLLYKASGLKSRALAVFRRVLEVEPAHEQALAQITELEPPPPPEDPGLLKKLFGRR
jgi:curved DNA-binding protein CbpA